MFDSIDCNRAYRYGCFLIIPLKYSQKDIYKSIAKMQINEVVLSSQDYNECVDDILTYRGKCYALSQAYLETSFGHQVNDLKFIGKEGQNGNFDIKNSYLFVFDTYVAFLALQLWFDNMDTINCICTPGHNDSCTIFEYLDEENHEKRFCFADEIECVISQLGLTKFHRKNESVLTSWHIHMLVSRKERFGSIEELKNITYNVNRMKSVLSENDHIDVNNVRFIYSVKNERTNTYGWGYCVSALNVAHIISDKENSFDYLMNVELNDSLPITLIALYEKYTCLRFTDLIAHNSHSKAFIQDIKTVMMNFRAYSTVKQDNFSRWRNINDVYAACLELNGVNDAIDDIKDKLYVITEREEKIDSKRSERFINIITVFGIISILDSTQNVIETLNKGESILNLSTLITFLLIIAILSFSKLRK